MNHGVISNRIRANMTVPVTLMLPSAPGGPNKGFSSRSRLGTCSDLGDELSLLFELSLRPESDLLRFAEPK